MSDGELLTKIISQTTFRVTPHGTEEIVNIEGISQIIREAKADFGLDRLIFSKEHMERQLTSGELTQVERSFVEICLKLIKWFGCNESHEITPETKP